MGKTSLSVNLAWAAAVRSGRRTLLWDLDAQAASTYILRQKQRQHDEDARGVLDRSVDPHDLIEKTATRQLDLLPADASLRSLDAIFADIDKGKRLRKLTDTLSQTYDRIILDCPPGLGTTSEQIIRGASVLIVPMIPSELSRRAWRELQEMLVQSGKRVPPAFPVFNLADRRRSLHRQAIASDTNIPVIPAAALFEQMPEKHAAIGQIAPRSKPAQAVDALWRQIETWIIRKGPAPFHLEA